ncbi:MAG: HepT-like ribonuclease domain-containing protein [Deltaproteobacteria bacterium]|nr:HepT-like ribonuclease domain-containing protein [Deltaproteobacteria bacterium]
MQIDRKRLNKYLDEIASETIDIERLLAHPDDEIISDQHLMKSLKYSTIVIAEAIAATLQHVLAKRHNAVVEGYMEVFRKTREFSILPADLVSRLQPFLRFRNMLVHQYWRVNDRTFLANLRDGLADFHEFGLEIRELPAETGMDMTPTNQGA